jgi:iron complex outermembrane receptor protein
VQLRFLSLLAWLVFTLTLVAEDGEPARRAFDVPADDAGAALRIFIQQAGKELVYPAEAVRGVRTRAVKGELTPREALDQMLLGTELVASEAKNGILVVNRVNDPNVPRAAQNSSRPATRNENDEGRVVLPTFDVSGSKPVGYGTTNALGATRMNMAVKDTPNAIVILNRELMDDMGTQDGLDILKYASGVGPSSTRTINVVTIRGQEVRPTNGSSYLDGLPGGYATEVETEFVDRIEFVKGPSGTLYGSMSIGGLINRVSKRPLPTAQTTLKASIDSVGGTVQGSFDTSQPLGDSGLALRAIGVVRRGETQTRDSKDDKEAIYLYGSYTPKHGPGRAWLRYSYQHIVVGQESANWFYDGAGQPSSFLGSDFLSVPAPAEARNSYHSAEIGYETELRGEHTSWNLRFVGRYEDQDSSLYAIVPTAYAFYDGAGNLIGKTSTAVAASQPKFSDPNWKDIRLDTYNARLSKPSPLGRQYGGYLDAVGSFETGPVAHKLLLYSQLTGAVAEALMARLVAPAGLVFSVIHPVYHRIDEFIPANPVLTQSTRNTSLAYNFGAQENASLFADRLILVGGVRYDYSIDHGTLNLLTNTRLAERVTNHWIYKGGIVAKPFPRNDGVSLFYNYSETFTPQTGTNLQGAPFKDISGTANEAGLKLELLRQGIVMTASVFRNENTNFPLLVFIPSLGANDYVQNGTGYVKGWEADIAWQPNPHWSFLLALSDVDSKNADGTRTRGVQNDFNYRAVAKYAFTDGPLQRLSTGAAYVWLAQRSGDNLSSFFLDPYGTLDVFASYAVDRWRMQLNVYNVFDGDGVESDIVASLAQVQRPLSARLTLQYSF